MDSLVQYATEARGAFFILGLLIFGVTGILFPFRQFNRKRELFRWANNLSLTLINSGIVHFLAPFSLIALARKNSPEGDYVWWILLAQVALLDAIIYLQHIAFHKVGFLYRLHRVHHSDTEYDSTTALRFHTLEIFISFFIKAFAIWAFSVQASAVILFEIVLNFSAMFNHGNYSLPKRFETVNFLIVTPDMHRIHHSLDFKERDSNYGFFLSIWDRIFKTYKSASRHDLRSGKIGTPNFRALSDQRLDQLLIQPVMKS